VAAPTHLPAPVGLREMLRRVMGLRCPRCGRGALFRSRFTMNEECAVCAFRFEREQGYFVGAIYVNYALTVFACVIAVVLIDLVVGMSIRAELAVAVPLTVLVPVVLFRYARSLWLGIEYMVTTADEAGERRRRRR
jgi:uncharacterized protein (DUF983 family)